MTLPISGRMAAVVGGLISLSIIVASGFAAYRSHQIATANPLSDDATLSADVVQIAASVAGRIKANVAVTFVVQAAFKKEGINGEPNLMWSGIFFSVLIGFAGGGAIGFYVDARVLDHGSMFLAAGTALIIALLAMNRPKTADPTSGGMIA